MTGIEAILAPVLNVAEIGVIFRLALAHPEKSDTKPAIIKIGRMAKYSWQWPPI